MMYRLQCGSDRWLAACLLLLAIQTMAGGPLRAQDAARDWEKAAGGAQQFDVASVRENKSEGRTYSNFNLDGGNNTSWVMNEHDKLSPDGSLFSANNMTLLRYIVFAYRLNGVQELALRFDYFKAVESHVPDWVRNNRYDINARAPGPATKDQMRLMMQSLLAEWFKLNVHWETRQAPVFALLLDKPGKPGPQLQSHQASDHCSKTWFPDSAGGDAPPLSALPIPCGWIARLPKIEPEERRLGGRNVPLSLLASSLPWQTGLVVIGRPVIDRTGLAGNFDFQLSWMPEDTSEVNNSESGGTFREALKNQLGLKLEPAIGPVEFLVIDHVVRPSQN